MRRFFLITLSTYFSIFTFDLIISKKTKADSAYGYGMQWCQMTRSGMDPFDSWKIITDSIFNNVPPSYQGDPYAPWSPTRTTSGAIASGISEGIVDGFAAAMRMSSLRPGMQQTMEANCPDFYYSASNYQFRNKKIKKKVCKMEMGDEGMMENKCRKKTEAELKAERPPVPINPKEKEAFCKINLYESDCKYYLDKKLKARLNSMPNQSQTIEQKLNEIQDLLDKGSINEKEYNVMRKKALGL